MTGEQCPRGRPGSSPPLKGRRLCSVEFEDAGVTLKLTRVVVEGLREAGVRAPAGRGRYRSPVVGAVLKQRAGAGETELFNRKRSRELKLAMTKVRRQQKRARPHSPAGPADAEWLFPRTEIASTVVQVHLVRPFSGSNTPGTDRKGVVAGRRPAVQAPVPVQTAKPVQVESRTRAPKASRNKIARRRVSPTELADQGPNVCPAAREGKTATVNRTEKSNRNAKASQSKKIVPNKRTVSTKVRAPTESSRRKTGASSLPQQKRPKSRTGIKFRRLAITTRMIRKGDILLVKAEPGWDPPVWVCQALENCDSGVQKFSIMWYDSTQNELQISFKDRIHIQTVHGAVNYLPSLRQLKSLCTRLGLS